MLKLKREEKNLTITMVLEYKQTQEDEYENGLKSNEFNTDKTVC